MRRDSSHRYIACFRPTQVPHRIGLHFVERCELDVVADHFLREFGPGGHLHETGHASFSANPYSPREFDGIFCLREPPEACRGSRPCRRPASAQTSRQPLPEDSPLWNLPNVVLLSHHGSDTFRYLDRGADLIRANLRRYVEGSPLLNVLDPAEAAED